MGGCCCKRRKSGKVHIVDTDDGIINTERYLKDDKVDWRKFLTSHS